MATKKFVKISDKMIEHVWVMDPARERDEDSLVDPKETVRVGPEWYANNGTPIEDDGDDMVYSHTEIKPVTLTVQVRGGVAYPPERMPKHVKLRIVDHDNS